MAKTKKPTKVAKAKPVSLRTAKLQAHQKLFLEALTDTRGNVKQAIALCAAQGVRIYPTLPYDWREKDPEFAKRMDDCSHTLNAQLQREAFAALRKKAKEGDTKAAEILLKASKAFDDAPVVQVNTQFVSLAQALAKTEKTETLTSILANEAEN